jgi:hypothetical protein
MPAAVFAAEETAGLANEAVTRSIAVVVVGAMAPVPALAGMGVCIVVAVGIAIAEAVVVVAIIIGVGVVSAEWYGGAVPTAPAATSAGQLTGLSFQL